MVTAVVVLAAAVVLLSAGGVTLGVQLHRTRVELAATRRQCVHYIGMSGRYLTLLRDGGLAGSVTSCQRTQGGVR